MPSIKFFSNHPKTNSASVSAPVSTIKELPEWYIDADRFYKMPNGESYIGPDGGKVPTWKSCPAMYDALGSGYVLRTPVDIEFFVNAAGHIDCKVSDDAYKEFVTVRPPMPDFKTPHGYEDYHFAWYFDWGIQTDKGYSTIYLTPMNRFDLPFQNTTGMIDTDSVSLPGRLPFFIAKGWTGTIPAGTPYVQLIPFKREDWKSKVENRTMTQMYQANMENSKKYRIPNGGVYQKDVWQRRKYE